MVLLKIFDVDSENNELPLSVLQPGEHTLGRGSFSNCNDKRISRNHAVVRVEDNSAYLTPIHVNPCFYIPISSTAVTILPKDVPVQLSDGDKFAFLSETWYRIKIINNEPNLITLDHTEHQNDEVVDNTECPNDVLPDNVEQQNNGISNSTEHQNEVEVVRSIETVEASCSSSEISPLKRTLAELNSTEGRKKLKTIEQSLDQLLDNFKSIENQDFPNGETDRNPGGVIKKNVLSSDDSDNEADNNEVTRDITIIPRNDDDSSDDDSDDPITDVNKEPMDTNQDNSNNQGETTVKTENPDSCKEEPGAASTSTGVPKSRREKCWYDKECFRKNPSHRENFSHPGDSDYASDKEDDRPECAYGSQCYRTNIQHRREYKHKNPRPAPKPSSRKRRRLTHDTSIVIDLDDEDEDPYGTSESEASEPSEQEDDTGSDFSDVDEDDEKRMFKEATKFLRKRKH